MSGFNPLWMFALLFILLLLGHPLGFALGGIAVIVGLAVWGTPVLHIVAERIFSVEINYLLIALPLFIFMGNMIERSGAAGKLFGALHIWLGGLKGGLALTTVIICTIFAAATGIIGASVTAMGLLALPEMLKRKYDAKLAAGTTMAASCLGILIPPSIMLVVYGSFAQMSVGRLFMACVFPGLLLATLYGIYIIVRCYTNPKMGPALPPEARNIPVRRKTSLLFTSIVPPIFLIIAVLGTIFLGICTPSEAAAIGAVGSILIAVVNHSFSLSIFKEAIYRTAKTTAMIAVIAAGAMCFTAVFLGLGGGIIIKETLLGLPLGQWGIFALLMLILFILGMFMDWFGILMICLPIYTPIIVELGLDPLWFAVLVCVNLQMSFLTPPFGYALFYMKGIAPPGITMEVLMRSVIPFLVLIIIGLAITTAFPQIALWLPSIMIK